MHAQKLKSVLSIAAISLISAAASAAAVSLSRPASLAPQSVSDPERVGPGAALFGAEIAPYPEYPLACARLADRLGDHVAAREEGDGTDLRLNLAISTGLSLSGQLGCNGEALAAIIAGAIGDHVVSRREK